MINLFKSQEEISNKIEVAIPEITEEEKRIRSQGRWTPDKEKPLIDNICLKHGIFRMREHVRKIKNSEL